MSTEMSNVGLSGQVKNEYTPPSASSQPNSYTPKANPSVIDNWKKSAQDVLDNKQTQFDIKEFFGDAVQWASPLLQAVGLGWIQSMFNKDSMRSQEDANIRAEKRANAEYDRRLADMREYNDPSAVSQRLLKAGVNPLSAFVNGGFQHSPSVSGPSPTGVSGQSNSLGGLSGLSSLMQTPTKIGVNESNIAKTLQETNNLTVDFALKNLDTLLKKQLYDFNEANNPILIKANLTNIAKVEQQIKTEESQENVNHQLVANLKEERQQIIANTALLVLKQATEKENTAVAHRTWEKLYYEIQSGKWQSKMAETEFTDFYESGIFKKKNEAEQRRIKALADKAEKEFDVYMDLLGDPFGDDKNLKDFMVSLWRHFYMFTTEIF